MMCDRCQERDATRTLADKRTPKHLNYCDDCAILWRGWVRATDSRIMVDQPIKESV